MWSGLHGRNMLCLKNKCWEQIAYPKVWENKQTIMTFKCSTCWKRTNILGFYVVCDINYQICCWYKIDQDVFCFCIDWYCLYTMIQAPTSTCLIAGWAENAITGLLPCPFLPSAGNQKIKAKGRSLEIISFARHRFAFRLCLVKVWKYFIFF